MRRSGKIDAAHFDAVLKKNGTQEFKYAGIHVAQLDSAVYIADDSSYRVVSLHDTLEAKALFTKMKDGRCLTK